MTLIEAREAVRVAARMTAEHRSHPGNRELAKVAWYAWEVGQRSVLSYLTEHPFSEIGYDSFGMYDLMPDIWISTRGAQ